MLKNKNIICISSIDWDFVWQGHQEIMAAFAKGDNRVLFIENTGIRVPRIRDIPRLKKRFITWIKSVKGFRHEMENLDVYSPMLIPFPYSRIARWINRRMFLGPLRRWMKVMDFHRPIIWTFLPTGTALDIIDNIDRGLLVYYCIADFYELADNFKKVKKTEDELIKKCDLIFAQGEILKKKCGNLNANVHIFPFGVNIEVFGNIKAGADIDLSDIDRIKKPVIGYIGGVHRHMDFRLLEFIARSHPEWSIVLVGPVQARDEELEKNKNIFFLGAKDFSMLPYYINKFDVCTIPYLKTEYTATVFPTKLNEYHVLGKPVVSTALPEVIKYNKENENLVLIGDTYESFVNNISKSLKDSDVSLVAKRKIYAKKNNWVARIDEMSNLIEEAINKKANRPFDWRESLLGIYKTVRRKTLGLVFAFLSIYLLIFYTSLVWFLAEPLKIVQAPQKAEAIVVFGGGVGESGKAEQGYEERVNYAVNLYKQGYARHLIFSSGYMFIFKEPVKMKALAISLGVPEEAIILEDKAANTYENVRFSRNILGKNNWKNILLVSSPYHMRRVSLVFNKFAKDIGVTYAPIPNSAFYSHPENDTEGRIIYKRIDLKQIRGIVHEYSGILYYWWKGYI